MPCDCSGMVSELEDSGIRGAQAHIECAEFLCDTLRFMGCVHRELLFEKYPKIKIWFVKHLLFNDKNLPHSKTTNIQCSECNRFFIVQDLGSFDEGTNEVTCFSCVTGERK